jgi:Cu(I)/Ag(I) efflux system membrane fusion protein/cobalt-zinc-cadmium efflux system membrane fusion protein
LAISARKRLGLWEIPKSHIDRILKTGNGQLRLKVLAPRSGFILHKNVVLGNRVNAGVDLYRIGNLTKIWVTAEVYEYDAPWVEVGQEARMSLSFQEGKSFEGRVSYVYPTLNAKSRTLTVRLEFENPGLNLKPGMFATVYIEALRREGVISIPTEAIIHSGERKLVFVSKGGGEYAPYEVVTGLVGDNRQTEILSGLKEHQVVVVSGQFLLDSESQLQEAIQKMIRAKLQKPKAVASEGSTKDDHKGHGHEKMTLYTCPMHPQVIKDKPDTCPICGMDLVKKKD